MLRVDAGPCPSHSAGISRRSFVQLGAAGIATLGLPGGIRLREASARSEGTPKDPRVILIWLDGGPSHLDLYDMKPEAPPEYRGMWRPIRTRVPGMEISELLPRQARVADKFSIIRSISHNDGEHFSAAHRMLTGRPGPNAGDRPSRYPSIGSIATRVTGPRRPSLPPYVSIPQASSIGQRPGYFGAHYLGQPYDPFETEGDPNKKEFVVRNLELAKGLSVDRLQDRRNLLRSLDTLRRLGDAKGQFEAMDTFEQKAYELVTGTEVRQAFDLSSESDELRDRYGRNTWGQSTLLARRLAEAGVTFTTVLMAGWDHHWNLKGGMEDYLPKLDSAVATLFEDLTSRGLLDKVSVVIFGEFSRTPRMNDGSGQGTPGRDHWGNSMSVVMGGGGVKGGVVVGSTDAKGEAPVDRPFTPQDFHATLYRVLGVDPYVQFPNHQGRPVPAIDQGEPIKELF
ncbi:MAG TPA: DUF1501 domain-containing protein [Planctomycetota bacterium]|nr:DUF1501 domain-containing protein [Planctomycetota bacterium]